MTITLEIDGMHCATCVQAIEKQLKKVSGVESVVVNLVTEQAQISVQDSVTIQTLIAAVKKAGYEAFQVEE